MSNLQNVDLSRIDFEDKEYIFRHNFDTKELENSIKYEGLLFSPIIKEREDGRCVIIAGYRRLSACRNLQMSQVPCQVYHSGELDKEDFLKMSIAENTKRRNLKPIEIAEALVRIKDELEISTEDLAFQFGETFGIGSDRETIEKYLKLNLFDEKTKDFLTEEASDNVEFEIASVDQKDDREVLLDLVKENQKIKHNQVHKIIENARAIQSHKHQHNADFSEPETDSLQTEKPANVVDKETYPVHDISGDSGKTSAGLKELFEDQGVRSILADGELKGNKKINALLQELEKKADPETASRKETYAEIMGQFDHAIQELDESWVRKISLKKPKYHTQGARLIIDFSSSAEFSKMIKFLYEVRHKILEPVCRL